MKSISDTPFDTMLKKQGILRLPAQAGGNAGDSRTKKHLGFGLGCFA